MIKELIQKIASEHGGLARIARARGKLQAHSTVQYPSFISKIEDVETCLKNLGYEIRIIKISAGTDEQKRGKK